MFCIKVIHLNFSKFTMILKHVKYNATSVPTHYYSKKKSVPTHYCQTYMLTSKGIEHV